VQAGYHCEECEEAIFPATTRQELAWMKQRRHVVAEVARHMSGGLDLWMMEALAFLDHHEGHSIVITHRG